MGKPMGRYSVTAEEKAATLELAGWVLGDDDRWRKLPRAARALGLKPLAIGQGHSLDGAWRIWRDEP